MAYGGGEKKRIIREAEVCMCRVLREVWERMLGFIEE